MSAAAARPALAVQGTRDTRPFRLFAWIVLAYNIAVILWGAYVRVSFSGDGCGANWPFCNGQVVPHNMSIQTAIEFTHRMMTSVDSAAVIALCAGAFYFFPKRHAVRSYALWSLVFLFIEALLGAGLVLFRLVAHDQSAGRAIYLGAHLTNTLLLLASFTVTAWAAQHGAASVRLRQISRQRLASLGVIVLISVTGAIAALGDTLFPSAGVSQDFASGAAPLLRLRLFHPAVAIAGAGFVFWVLIAALRKPRSERDGAWSARVLMIAALQIAIGIMNVALRAPLWMQIVHLLVADVFWIAAVIWTLESLSEVAYSTPSQTARP